MALRPLTQLLVFAVCGAGLAVACGGDDDGGGGSSSGGAAGSSTGGASSGGTSSGGTSSGGTSSDGGGAGGTSSGGAAGTGGSTGGSGGSTGGSGGTGGAFPLDCKSFSSATVDAACTSFSTEYCKLIGKCAPLLLQMLGVGSESQCASRMKLVCQSSASAPGNNTKPALYAAYGSFLSGLTCDAMWDGTLESANTTGSMPAECGGPGSIAGGKNCYSDPQCSSGECNIPSDAVCGKCASTTGGEACQTNGDCADGFWCDFNDKCAAQKATGSACTGSSECVDDAFCDGTTKKCTAKGGAGAACANASECKSPYICGANKQCKLPAMGSLGASCDPNEAQSCNTWLGLECSKTTSKCVTSVIPGPGEQCGLLQTDAGAVFAFYCSGGAMCVDHTSGPNTCMLPAADGASCTTTDGPPCTFPAECVGGKCTLPSAAACPAN